MKMTFEVFWKRVISEGPREWMWVRWKILTASP